MAPPPAKKGGSFLTKKVGPVPAWLLLVGLALGGWWLYRRYSGASGSSNAAVETQTTAAATPASSLGDTTQAGAPADTGQSTSDLVTALGGEQSSLLSELESVNQDVVGLASSQLNYASTQTSLGSFNTQTQPAAGTQPGGSNAPVIQYLAPAAVAPQAGAGVTAAPVKATTSTTPTRFYTFKRDVPLASGQTVHFTTGRGYYAA
jgi:hypothetical protein